MATDHIDTLLHTTFELASFRPGQREVIAALNTTGRALAVFPTGGGKSLCYQLPALLFNGVTVVVSPLIALMKDQIDVLQRRGIAAARLDSSLDTAAYAHVGEQLRNGTLKLLYVAPERFTNERFLEQLARTPIALFAVDEAHCISEWGHNFRPDYLKLADTTRSLGVERVLALTATATPQVVADICASFEIPPTCAIITGFHRPNLMLSTMPTPAARRDAVLRDRIHAQPPGSGIVYVTLQKTAERLAAYLAAAGVPARAYHAGMDDVERSAVQEWWQASDRATVVATIAFGMGIDKADVRYVYHYNLPKSLESYSQEIGRAGRDGMPSVVELLGSPDDLTTLENFVYGDTPTPEALDSLLAELFHAGPMFDVSLYDLANRHDIRPLVLRTALTYLELRGVLRQGTPFYASYKARLLRSMNEIVAQFRGERQTFVSDVFGQSKQGRTWYILDPAAIAEQLGQERQRVVRMLEYLAEQGEIELTVADARQRYTCLLPDVPTALLGAELAQRFARREAQEIARLRQVIELIETDGCQTNALLRYFGEQRTEPCGHCTFCTTGRRTRVGAPASLPPIAQHVDADTLTALRTSAPDVLGHARQQARFLCGLTSPATTRAKLTKHTLFGVLDAHRFGAVLAWCVAQQASS